MFSSQRERRLWRCTLISILGIYLTLPLASTFAEYLYNQGFAAIAFLTAMALVAATVVMQALETRPRGVEIGVGIGIAVVYLLVLFRLTLPERSHLIEYSVVAAFTYEALLERKRHHHFPIPAILAIVLTSAAGTIDELIQYVLPNRHFELTDILFNVLASVMAVVAIVILRGTRKLLRDRQKTNR